MINKKYLKLLRSKDRKYGENFIYNEISKNIIDSLDILKVHFREQVRFPPLIFHSKTPYK